MVLIERVKATTTEKLGFVGTGKVRAHAVTLLIRLGMSGIRVLVPASSK